MIDPLLEDKVVLITGANNPQGIGAGIAKAFAVQGAKVFITYVRLPVPPDIASSNADSPGLAMYHKGRAQNSDAVVTEIREAGGTIEAWEADLSDPAVIPALFDRVEQTFGAVDVLVHNAASWKPATFIPPEADLRNQFSTQWMESGVPQITAETHDFIFSVNARTTALLITEFANRHVKRSAEHGRIITISTDSARNFPSEIAYGASKTALESYSRSAASELGQFGITVNIVSPGPIQTGYITEDMEQSINENTPLGRVGYPDDIADVVVFLASEQGRWVSGQLIHVGGGHRI